MAKLRLGLAQFGNSYGGQQALPLSVGCVWAMARTEVGNEFEEPIFLYKKESISKSLARLDPMPHIVAFSSYVWNFEYNRALAKAIKEVSKYTMVVYGGVHVPDKPDEAWWNEHEEVDVLIQGEGELAFTEFLKWHISDAMFWDLEKVPGIATNSFQTERKFPGVEQLRSPYLDGVFDKLLPLENKWTGLQETNRGCPYHCTFCEWGASALNKIRPFPMDRVMQEIEWFGKNQVEYIEGCDANFGILPRDVEIAEALAKTKEKYGYPQKYRAAFAKYSNQRISEQVFKVAKTLHNSGQLKAVTMALQSTDSQVLEAIDRKNISLSGFAELQQRYRNENIPTYVELILGLPGETEQTFKDGLERVLQAGGHENLSIYPCVLLPNSEMDHPAYKEKYGIQAVPMRAMLLHGTPNPDAPDEVQRTVIATKAMPHEAWKRCYMLSWIIQTLHCMGLTQWWAIKQHKEKGLPYVKFYETILHLASDSGFCNGILHKVYNHTLNLLEGAIKGGSWDNVLPKFGDISWPPDEGAFLLLTQNLDLLHGELSFFCDMPKEQREIYGPPAVPEGHEEGYGKALWFGKRGNLLGELRKFVSSVNSENK